MQRIISNERIVSILINHNISNSDLSVVGNTPHFKKYYSNSDQERRKRYMRTLLLLKIISEQCATHLYWQLVQKLRFKD